MKLGPLDLNQPSTWRGLLGLIALGGWTLAPALRDQIAAAIATLLCLIEMVRDEYHTHTTATTIGPRPAPDAAAQQRRAPARPDATDRDPPESNAGFGDR